MPGFLSGLHSQLRATVAVHGPGPFQNQFGTEMLFPLGSGN